MSASSEEHADQEVPSSATGGADGACDSVTSSVTTGTESCTKSPAVSVAHSSLGSTRSWTRGRTRRTRPHRRKRATSSSAEDAGVTLPGLEKPQKQERRDDAPTSNRVSIVQRALSEPDSLTPVEVDRLVRVVFWKAIHDDDTAGPAARFCASVITAELDGMFIDRLLWACRDWFKQRDVPLRRSAAKAPAVPLMEHDAGHQLTAFVSFMATLLSAIPGSGTAASVGSCHSGHLFCLAALLCDSCKLVLRSPDLDWQKKVECLHNALTTAGEAAERGAPTRMVALVACLRDAFLSPDASEENRLTLLELIELRASGWKLSLEQQLHYTRLSDGAAEECDDVQNSLPLPCRVAE